MILLWSGLALAAPACPDVAGLVAEAQSAFDEAEVQQARGLLTEAHASMACQSMVVSRESLLALYHLDALVSVAGEDSKAALFAIIRAVTIDPDQPPPADVGPELLAQHGTWADRIRQDRVRVTVSDPTHTVWIDGQAVNDTTLDVVTGQHLVQVRGPNGWKNQVAELSVRGDVGALPIILQPVPVLVDPVDPGLGTRPQPGPIPAPSRPERRVNMAVAVTGSVLALVGGGAIAGGYLMEQRFAADPYDADRYGDCTSSQACWSSARADKIGKDARNANMVYLAGYGLTGVGLGIVGMELFVLRTSAGSNGLGLRGRW